MRDCPTVLSEDGLISRDPGLSLRLLQKPFTEIAGSAIAQGFGRFRIRYRGGESRDEDAAVIRQVRLDERSPLRA
jgi:hypothetical protein